MGFKNNSNNINSHKMTLSNLIRIFKKAVYLILINKIIKLKQNKISYN